MRKISEVDILSYIKKELKVPKCILDPILVQKKFNREIKTISNILNDNFLDEEKKIEMLGRHLFKLLECLPIFEFLCIMFCGNMVDLYQNCENTIAYHMIDFFREEKEK